MVQVLLLAGSVAGTLSQCGWCREEPSPGSDWGQLVALSTCLSLAPRDGRTFHFHSDQVTFTSAGGRGSAEKWSLWADESSKAPWLYTPGGLLCDLAIGRVLIAN